MFDYPLPWSAGPVVLPAPFVGLPPSVSRLYSRPDLGSVPRQEELPSHPRGDTNNKPNHHSHPTRADAQSAALNVEVAAR